MPTYSPARLAGVAVTAEVIPENTIRVLDHGFVRLDDAMADDLSVANGARVSFARRKEELDESDEGLIRFLMRERHGTPFEHNAFRFHVRCPIFVAREWFRHRVGSFNEFSLRYAKATDDFYVPEPEDVRSQVGKPGAYSFEPVSDELAEATREKLQAVYETAYLAYEQLVELGVARELARSGAAGRRLHRVLLDGQRALADELPLAAQLRDRAARDPPLRRGLRAVPGREDAGHVRGLRRERPHGSLGRRQHDRVLVAARPLARHDPAVERAQPVGRVQPDLVARRRRRGTSRTRPRAGCAPRLRNIS